MSAEETQTPEEAEAQVRLTVRFPADVPAVEARRELESIIEAADDDDALLAVEIDTFAQLA